jgi:hypothetical protein
MNKKETGGLNVYPLRIRTLYAFDKQEKEIVFFHLKEYPKMHVKI